MISELNLRYFLSGGTGNTNPALSLGGAISGVAVSDTLFPRVSGDQARAGLVTHRCIYFKNEDADLNGLLDPIRLWIDQLSTGADDEIDLGVDPVGKNFAAQLITDDETPPVGVTFSRPTSKGSGIALDAPLGQGDYQAIWVRRTVNAGAARTDASVASWRIEGDTI